MDIDGQSDATIRAILSTPRRIALVGASAKPWRDSHHVMAFLLRQGHDVTPVNPHLTGQEIHDRPVVRATSPPPRRWRWWTFSAPAGTSAGVVDDAIRLGASIVWLQLGVIDQDAAERRAPPG